MLTVAAGPRDWLYIAPKEVCTKERAFGARNYT